MFGYRCSVLANSENQIPINDKNVGTGLTVQRSVI